jgi:hypothetical protein
VAAGAQACRYGARHGKCPVRRRLAFVAVLAASVGYLLRSAAERRLVRLQERRKTRRPRGRVLLRDIPHRYAEERFWPGSCWCNRKERHGIHQASSGAAL